MLTFEPIRTTDDILKDIIEIKNKQAILGIVRHILTFGGGFMTQNGLATGEEVTTGVSAAVTLIGVIWSVMSKKK